MKKVKNGGQNKSGKLLSERKKNSYNLRMFGSRICVQKGSIRNTYEYNRKIEIEWTLRVVTGAMASDGHFQRTMTIKAH